MSVNQRKRRRVVSRKLVFESADAAAGEGKPVSEEGNRVESPKEFEDAQSSGSKQANDKRRSPVLYGAEMSVRRTSRPSSPVLLRRKSRKRSPAVGENRKKFKTAREPQRGKPSAEPSSPILLPSNASKKSKRKAAVARVPKRLPIEKDDESAVASEKSENPIIDTRERSPPDSSRCRDADSRSKSVSHDSPSRSSRPTFFFFEGKDIFRRLRINDDDKISGGRCPVAISSEGSSRGEPIGVDYSPEGDTRCEGNAEDESRAFEADSAVAADRGTPPRMEPNEATDDFQELDSGGKKNQRQRRGTLLDRLENIKRKEASEKRIHEHKKKTSRGDHVEVKNLLVVHAWRDGPRTILKCQQTEVDEAGPSAYLYVVADGKLGNDHKKIAEGSFMRIFSPWQYQRLNAVNATIYLSVNCLELTDANHGAALPEVEMRQIPKDPYKGDESLFFDALLAPESSTFLHKPTS